MKNGWFSSYLFSFAQGPLGTGDMQYTTDTIKIENNIITKQNKMLSILMPNKKIFKDILS